MNVTEIDIKNPAKPLSKPVEDPDDDRRLKWVKKAVDFTEYCPKIDKTKRTCIISYYLMKKGIFVQVTLTWEMRNYDGITCCPFHLERIDEYLNGAGLGEVMKHMGINDKTMLKKLIEENVPAT